MHELNKYSRRFTLLIPIGILTQFVSACTQEVPAQDATAQKTPPEVNVSKPLVKTIVEWDEYIARLGAVESVEVRARVSGYLESIHFKEGSIIKTGDLLFVIDPRSFKAELDRLEAELKQEEAAEENAFAQFRRAESLLKSNSISEEEYQIRRANRLVAAADVQSVRAAIEVAKLNLEFTQVRAPISGRISRPFVTEGNLVHGGTGQTTHLTTIVSLDPTHAYFEASESGYICMMVIHLVSTDGRYDQTYISNYALLNVHDELARLDGVGDAMVFGGRDYSCGCGWIRIASPPST